MGQEWARRLADLLGNNFNRGTMGEGVGNPPSGEEVLDQVGKERVQCDVDRRDIITNKTGLKGANLKSMHMDEEVPVGELCGGRSHTSSGKSARLGASLKCLYTNAYGMGNKQEKSEVCMSL